MATSKGNKLLTVFLSVVTLTACHLKLSEKEIAAAKNQSLKKDSVNMVYADKELTNSLRSRGFILLKSFDYQMLYGDEFSDNEPINYPFVAFCKTNGKIDLSVYLKKDDRDERSIKKVNGQFVELKTAEAAPPEIFSELLFNIYRKDVRVEYAISVNTTEKNPKKNLHSVTFFYNDYEISYLLQEDMFIDDVEKLDVNITESDLINKKYREYEIYKKVYVRGKDKFIKRHYYKGGVDTGSDLPLATEDEYDEVYDLKNLPEFFLEYYHRLKPEEKK